MQTLHELLKGVRELRPTAGSGEGWPPPGLKPKARLAVPGQRALVLPGDVAGYESIDTPPTGDAARLLGEVHRAARAALIAAPGLVLPLMRPSDDELRVLGVDLSEARHGWNPRAIGTAIAVDSPAGRVWGVGALVAIEGGLRFGSTRLVSHEVSWTLDREEFEYSLADLHTLAADCVSAAPEANAPRWRRVVLLLGDPGAATQREANWRRVLELAAGLREVRLQIRTNPEGSKARVVRSLRTDPPDALLVWAGGVSKPSAYLEPYLGARRSGYAETLGTRSDAPLAEHVRELLMHLREMDPRGGGEQAMPPAEAMDWATAGAQIRALAGPHFVLTNRASEMIEGNPYPAPARMLDHLTRLAGLALRYYTSAGVLGGQLVTLASEEHQIEVALSDKGLSPPPMKEFGGLVTDAHVKVDDFKSPAECGRIYFAIDRTHHRFVVDHIGLHDYH